MSDIAKLTSVLKDLVEKATGPSTLSKVNSDINLAHPEPFDIKDPSKWSQWIRRFEVYRSASGLSGKTEDQQINCLVYCLGSEADNLLTSIGLPSEKRETYQQVRLKFDEYFTVTKNIFFERTQFLQRVQGDNESVDCYINELYKLIAKCEWECQNCSFGKNILLLKLVSGLSDRNLSTQLQLQKDLTLESAITRIRQVVSIEKEQDIVRRSLTSDSTEIMKVKKYSSQTYKCSKCGKVDKSIDLHNKRCPAKNSNCHRCKKIGHWAPMCTQKRAELNQVDYKSSDHESNNHGEPVESNLDSVYMTVADAKDDLFYTNIKLNGVVVRFKIDSGADVCVCGPELANKLNLKVKATDRILRGAGNCKLSVIGVSEVELQKGSILTKQEMFVVQGQREPLLGKNSIVVLGLLNLSVDNIGSEDEWARKYPNIFNGLGVLKGKPYTIKLSSNAVPFSISSPRRIALPLKPKLKEELDRMVKADVISPVFEATEWCSPIVVAPKKNGSIRLCVDYTELNKFVVRERLMMPSTDELITNIDCALVMSKLDAQSGFWQVEIDQPSQPLTTFITPFGRYYFKRLPFGITSAPEHFQRKMAEVVEGLDGVVNLVDDFLVYGKNDQEHDVRLHKLLERLQEHGITLNKEKCEFRKGAINFLGHRIENGKLLPDPDKVSAIKSMEAPHNPKELRSFLGMVNYLMKFIPNLSDQARPLRELLSTKYDWTWSSIHQRSFDKIKSLVARAVSLVMFDYKKNTRVCADSSSYGIGAVLEQQYKDGWRPVQFISRGLSEVERRYAQIEKEALALTWACERFYSFLSGLGSFILVTDHLPLVQILSNKPINTLSARLQRFRMRLLPFKYTILHEKGKEFFIPDLLSRNPVQRNDDYNSSDVLEEMELHVSDVVTAIPVTPRRYTILKQSQVDDVECKLLRDAIRTGEWNKLKNTPFFKERGSLTLYEDLILHNNRIYVPHKLRSEVLDSIHKGHQGVSRCISRARDAVWWPGMYSQIKQRVEGCLSCIENQRVPTEPLIPCNVPERPWQILGTDLLMCEGKQYIVIQDYFSKYIELVQINKTDALAIIKVLKSVFARHGIPEVLRSDNSPFNCKEIKKFASENNFELVTSSPTYARSNGQAERAVQIAKNILKKNSDPYDGLLAYRSTPLSCGYSPSELLFGRKIRSTVPILNSLLTPCWPDLKGVQRWYEDNKHKQKKDFDSRHQTSDLRKIDKGETVWVSNLKRYGVICDFGVNTREYVVDVGGRLFRRNRIYLVPTKNRFKPNQNLDEWNVSHDEILEPDEGEDTRNSCSNEELGKNQVQYETRFGRQVRKPKRFIEQD